MSLKVIKQGLLDTVQDLGRNGFQHLGINPGGAMDRFAAQVANLLVGNARNEAVIELHFPASVFLFGRPVLIALSGADFQPSLNGDPIPMNHPILINKNSILQFHRVNRGARTYLAIRGGLDIEPWLGSLSTNLKAGVGGFLGRALHKGDEIRCRKPGNLKELLGEQEFRVLPWASGTKRADPAELFVLPGREWDRLTTESRENFLMTSFVITQHSDRMGYHLNNIPLSVMSNAEIVSTPVSFGTVQLVHGGRLIVLMADHQTTGGYPRIAHVITAHHSRLAQMKPGDKVKFTLTDPVTAEKMMAAQEHELLQLQYACRLRLSEIELNHA